MLEFRLPSPPSVNALFANVPGKGRVRTERYRIWARAAGTSMKVRDGKLQTWQTLTGPVAVEIISGNHRADLDNGVKATIDLLVDMAVIADDDQLVDLHVLRGPKSKETTVIVRPADLLSTRAAA